MTHLLFRLILGLAVISITILVYLFCLPGSPSQYSSRFQVSESPPPSEFWHSTSDKRIGYDIYSNVKGLPALGRKSSIPIRVTTQGVASSQQNGIYYIHETLWVEVNGTLYAFAKAQKEIKVSHQRFFAEIKTLSIEDGRNAFITIEAPELNVHETFGPFQVP